MRLLLACSLPLALTGCFESWVTTCPGERFCYEHPDYLVHVDGPAGENLSGKHEGKGLTVHYDYGKEVGDFPELAGNPAVEVAVGNERVGRLIDARERNSLMALTALAADDGPRLAILVHHSGKLDPEVAERILKSVRLH